MVQRRITKTETKSAEVVDLAEFKRQRQIVVQQATAGIADRIKQIEVLLGEIEYLKEVSGVPVDLSDVFDKVNSVDTENDWNSSSMYC